MKFFLHLKHCLNEPSANYAVDVGLLHYIHTCVYDARVWLGFIVDVKLKASFNGVCGKLIVLCFV